jgi:hypothetical protein
LQADSLSSNESERHLQGGCKVIFRQNFSVHTAERCADLIWGMVMEIDSRAKSCQPQPVRSVFRVIKQNTAKPLAFCRVVFNLSAE